MASRGPVEINRQETTPFLLRLFYRKDAFPRLEEFTNARLPDHLQIYTWQSCTLSELTHLLVKALPSLLPAEYAGTRIAFRLVYADAEDKPPRLRFISRDLGSVIVGATSSDTRDRDGDGDAGMEDRDEGKEEAESAQDALKQLSGELNKTLHDARFVIGDYISAAILPPLPDGTVAPTPPPPAGPSARGPPVRDGFGGRPGPRENAYRENGYRDSGYRGRGSDFDRFGRGGRGGGRFEDRRGGFGNVPNGEWRRGEAPPPAPERDAYRGRGGGGGGGGWGRGRGGGRW